MAKVSYSYLRFSSPPQEWGDSERRQQEAGAELAKELGCVMADDGWYADHGVSGFRGKNSAVGQLKRFLDRVKAGDVPKGSVLVVENLDRLGRDELLDAVGRFADILRAGVEIATTTPRRVYTRASASQPMVLLEAIMFMQRGWEESELKSKRCLAEMEERRRNAGVTRRGKRPNPPGWLLWEEGKWSLHPVHSATVRQMFEWALAGDGAARIAARLRADPDRFPAWGPSGTWNPTTVWTILRSSAAAGDYQGHHYSMGSGRRAVGDPVKGAYPAVVSPEEWREACRALTRRRRTPGARGPEETNLFTRLVRNAVTGQPMGLHSFTWQGTRYPALRDTRYRGETQPGFGNRFPYALVEESILRAIAGLEVSDLLPPASDAGQFAAALADAEQQLRQLADRADELQAQLADLAGSPGIVARVVAALRELESQQQPLAARVEALRARQQERPDLALGAVKDAIGYLAALSPADRQAGRLKVKERLRDVLASVQVVIQRWHKRAKIAHIQLHYRTGGWTTLRVQAPGRLPAGAIILDLDKVDLRRGYPDGGEGETTGGGSRS